MSRIITNTGIAIMTTIAIATTVAIVVILVVANLISITIISLARPREDVD